MCILLNLDYTTFGVSTLFFQKSSKNNFGKEGLTFYVGDALLVSVCVH